MKLLSIDNYIDFECIGGNCPISCCGGNWRIDIDAAAMDRYKSVEGEFGERLRNGIIKNGDSHAFRLDENTGDCVFLNENKLCSIYRELGPDALCFTCRSYPRSMYQVGDIMFCFLANSCPEVNRIIVQKSEQMKTLFDDSDGDTGDSCRNEDVPDYKRFNDAIKAFNTGMHIIQDQKMTFKERLYLLLFFIERFQDLVRSGKDVAGLIELFSQPEVYRMFLESRTENEAGCADKIHIFMMVYRTLLADSYDHPMWVRCKQLADDIVHMDSMDIGVLRKAFLDLEKKGIGKEFERLMIYRFFAVFMMGFEDQDYLDKLAYEIILNTALAAYTALTEAVQGHECTQEDRILFYSLCARIDHTKNQKEKLVGELKRDGCYEIDKLIRLVG